MRITITCEDCGHRHNLARRVSDPGEIWVVCHGCELPLRALLDEATAARRPEPATADLRMPFASVWGDTLDLGVGSA